MTSAITFFVNGTEVTAEAADREMPLAEFLCEDRGLTGTKQSCEIGVCRACTVAVQRDGKAPLGVLLSCMTPLSELAGAHIHTVEGLEQRDETGQAVDLHPLQRAFLTHFAFQCGYCTPGFLMAAVVLMDRLRRSPVAKAELDTTIAQALGVHICRCTGYVRYHDAVKQVILQTAGLTK